MFRHFSFQAEGTSRCSPLTFAHWENFPSPFLQRWPVEGPQCCSCLLSGARISYRAVYRPGLSLLFSAYTHKATRVGWEREGSVATLEKYLALPPNVEPGLLYVWLSSSVPRYIPSPCKTFQLYVVRHKWKYVCVHIKPISFILTVFWLK